MHNTTQRLSAVVFVSLYSLTLGLLGCQSTNAKETPPASASIEKFYNDNFLLRLEYENKKHNGYGDELSFRVILDDPSQNYAQARTLLVEMNPGYPLAWGALQAYMTDDEQIDLISPLLDCERIFFITRVDANGHRSGWAGPHLAESPVVIKALDAAKGMHNPFRAKTYAQDTVALIQDMRAAHGHLHRFNDMPYVIDWGDVSRFIYEKRYPDKAEQQSDVRLEASNEGCWLWVPIFVCYEDYFASSASGFGSLTATMDFQTGEVDTLWIDPN